MVKKGADPGAGIQLAGAELDAFGAVDAAIPAAEIAMAQHAVGQLAAEPEQVRTRRRFGRRPAVPAERLTAFQEHRLKAVEFGPKGVFVRVKGRRHGDGAGDPELGRLAPAGDVPVPRKPIPDVGIVPDRELVKNVQRSPCRWGRAGQSPVLGPRLRLLSPVPDALISMYALISME